MDGMIAMLPQPLQALSTHIDFQGQRVAERTYQVILTLAGIIGFFVGWYNQQLSHALFIVMGAAAFTGFLILPPWPFLFRKHPIAWQTPIPAEEQKAKGADAKKSEKTEQTDDKNSKIKKETKKTK